ncbi:MAG: hypothetical protein LC745_01930 [Planctomycetia bacterium]|nr:hypothetical protein [Planctomycetia bacterium]
MTTTQQRLTNLGWSDEEAKIRSKIIDRGDAYRAFLAKGLPAGHFVGVEGRDGRPYAAFVHPTGGLETAGEIGRFVSLPWERVGGEYWTMPVGSTVAVLADGRAVAYGGTSEQGRAHVVAEGVEYPDILRAAMALTPDDRATTVRIA